MRVLLLLLMTALPAEWGYAPRYRLLQMAKLVVAGEVIEIRTDPKGKSIARLKVERILKGKPESEVIDLPFKTALPGACDFDIHYESGKKYLLLLDDRLDFRVIHYPSGTHDQIRGLDDPDVVYVQLILDVMNGTDQDRGIAELLKRANDGRPGMEFSRREALNVFRAVPRARLRPHLDAVRAAYGTAPWMKLTPASAEWHYQCVTFMSAELEIVRDLSYVSYLLEESDFLEASLPTTLSLITGREVGDLAAFKKSWNVVLRRAKARSSPKETGILLKRLGSLEPGERDKAFQEILDCGPDAADAVEAAPSSPDPEIRARVAELSREFQLLKDVRSDLEAHGR